MAITSGGLEPVADKGGGENSPFAKAVMDGTTLFSKMRRPVMVNAEQTPQYSDVRNAGHDGDDFSVRAQEVTARVFLLTGSVP